jgi:hypothetical protein
MAGPVTLCQSCFSNDLELVISLGNLPPCNDYRPIGSPAREQITYPTDLLYCHKCTLVQLGYIAPQETIFPASYPYTSGTTRALRENFAQLAEEVRSVVPLGPDDLVIDIGGNDGTLLTNFEGCKRINVTPENIGAESEKHGIKWIQRYWSRRVVRDLLNGNGQAKVITATNVFAHVPDPHEFMEAVDDALLPDGTLVLECQSVDYLLEFVQYDHLYAEHLRFYSPTSLQRLLMRHGFGMFTWHPIATHGGSFRAYFRRGHKMFDSTDSPVPRLRYFARRVVESRAVLRSLLASLGPVAGLAAPSRAGTLIGFTGLDEHDVTYIAETEGSHKIGHYMPGTRIPVCAESRLYEEQPVYCMVLAWHIADDLMKAVRAKGYEGKFIIPLPEPRVVQ